MLSLRERHSLIGKLSSMFRGREIKHTGSRLFGYATADSDWDYYTRGNFSDVESLEDIGFELDGSIMEGAEAGFASLRFSSLNLIIALGDKWYDAYDTATQIVYQASQKQEWSREEAITVFAFHLYGAEGTKEVV